MKCTPWQADPVSKTLRAQHTTAYNTYTAYEMVYNAYFKTSLGKVEFGQIGKFEIIIRRAVFLYFFFKFF